MATPEGKVKIRVKKVLAEFSAWYHMPVQNGMGAPSLDFVGCFLGWFFAVETKAGDKQPTPRQEHTMQQMRAAGAEVFLVNEVSGLDLLRNWLTRKREEGACPSHPPRS